MFNLVTGVFIWLFLLLTRPFGLYVIDFYHFLGLAGLLIPVSLSFIIISYTIDFLMQRWCHVKINENFRKDQMSWIIKWMLFAHVIYLMRLVRCDWECFDWWDYLEQWFACLIMILFTYIPFMMYGRAKYTESSIKSKFRIRGEGKESILLNLNEIAYIKADDNYVDIYLLNGTNELYHQTIRSSLTAIEQKFKEFPSLKRVHRSYLINVKLIVGKKVSSVKLQSGEWQQDIPVSAKYKSVLKD